MCGICGYVGAHRPELLEPMCLSMVHRGPDDMGLWHDEKGPVGLGHRRLSIIDLSPAGHQPMTNEDGTVWISFNGEIYDFQEHRERLVAKGHQFKSYSDTEVLVHLYEEMGPDLVRELNGIFALAIWDSRKKQLFLARDHAGIKPLYYWQDGPRLYFASEIKALLRIPNIPRELNENAVPEYLTLLWVPGEETMLKAVRKIEPGHYLIWKDGRIETRQWFTLDYTADESVSESEWIDRVHDTFMRTTRRQMVSDVPLGAFLSGGADSSGIVACMRHSFPDREINCYSYTFDQGDMARDQFEYDFPYAEQVARHLGVTLKSFHLRPDVISILPKLVYHMDEPDADQSIFPAYLISKLAREDGTTVLLSGTGGDEVFFGYRSHQALRRMEKLGWVPRWLLAPVLAAATGLTTRMMGAQSALPRRLRKFRSALLGNGVERFLSLSDWSSPTARERIFSADFASRLDPSRLTPPSLQKYYDNFIGRGELNRRSHILIQTFLAAHNFNYTDKTSMAASVEARVPYLDVELMRLCAIIPERYKLKGMETKFLLKEAMTRYLPRQVLYRSKTGFGAPLRKWVADDLKDCLEDQLGPKRLGRRGLFDPTALRHILRENIENKADHAYLIYALLTLELWMQTFVDRAGEPVSL